ncbi:hypothetical protein [Paracoccus onubensis]|uniref:Sulfotransferase family protein n=1 Tax=Paracoccus onubensis TaxID=1675788 RepID=A0A418SZN5_9RHOB|nr:hypothetical protein [Paracoccus onubensis]RJE86403.1 hypothetical protein D3P04_06620 [Paracoccus onubensis]
MKRNIVLHLGAHRTGTTGLQTYLHKNDRKLKEGGCDLLYPPKSREVAFNYFDPKGELGIYSDENIVGYMEENIASAKLYPDAVGKLRRLEDLIDRIHTVYFSIRNHEDYWKSSISYCVQKNGLKLPDDEQLDKIAESERGWLEVIKDIRKLFPDGVNFHVREFNWKTDNPKQQLIAICKWPLLKETTLERKKHNPSADRDTLIRTLSERGAHDAVTRLTAHDSFELFSPTQKQKLFDLYMSDIDRISELSDVQFHSDATSKLREDLTPRQEKKTSGKVKAGEKAAATQLVCFLHIGKTGGTFLKSQFSSKEARARNIILSGHNMTLHKSLEAYGPQRRLAFFFRDPEERFVSSFYSRLRQGRPTHDVNWTAGEAAAYSFFGDPNSLAEALYGQDERLQSAARFAFSSIFHLALSHEHYLASPQAVENEERLGNILICCETKNIDYHWEKIIGILDAEEITSGVGRTNNSTSRGNVELSDIARSNLAKFWKKEFEIFETCKKVANRLGFDRVR